MSFAQACRQADRKRRRSRTDARLKRLRRLLADDVSVERAWRELNNAPGAPIATLHAAEFLLQQRDPERLRIWLEKHSMQERAEILRHLKERRRAPGK